jgi:hypothetical protein
MFRSIPFQPPLPGSGPDQPSPCSSSGRSGTWYSSPLQAPKSFSRQRSEQKGRVGVVSQETGLRQMGQGRTGMEEV